MRLSSLKIDTLGRITFQEAGHENDGEQLTRISFHEMDTGLVAFTYDPAFSRRFLVLDFSESQLNTLTFV